MRITCFYHDECMDGMASAWAVNQFCKKNRTHTPKFKAVSYNNPPPEYPSGLLILVDFIYTDIAIMRELVETAKRVIVIDHHPIAEKIIGQLSAEYDLDKFQGFFDEKRSGAGLTWDVLMGTKRPKLIDHVEDRDLWKFALPGTKAFCDGLRQYSMSMINYDFCAKAENYNALIAKGLDYERTIEESWKRNQARTLYNHSKYPRLTFSGFSVPFIEIDSPGLRSELASRFLSEAGEAMVGLIWKVGNDSRVRLVSQKGGLDVNLIARSFGGGGHPNAAGFTFYDMTPDELLA